MSAPGTSVRDRLVVLVTAFVVSLGMVAGITSAVTGGDEPERALPRTDEAVPVIAPVATGPTPPAEPDPATADGSGGGTGGGGTPSPDVSESAATDGGGSGGSDAPSTAGGGPSGSGSGGSEALPDYGLRFYDECAGTEPGATPPEGCPEGSVGGTVLALTDPYPQNVLFASPYPGGTGWATRCASGPLAEGEQSAVATTLNPGSMHLEIWPQADAAGWVYPGDGDPSITTIDRSTASESDPEHRLWAGWFEAGTLGDDYDKRVQYCLTLSDLREDQSYGFRVSSTDIFGSSATYTGSFGLHAPETRGRPPVTITPVDDTRVSVWVPIRSGRNEHAIVHAVPRSGPDAGTCADVEAGGLDAFGPPRGTRDATETTTEISGDERGAEGYPYLPAYDAAYEKQLSLEEGTTSAVCVWWQTGPTRSFDPSRITEREEHLVTAPNRYRFRATIERLTFTRPVVADGVEIDILRPGGGRLCTAAVPAEEVTLGDMEQVVVEPRDVFCDLTGNGDTAALGDAVDVKVTGPNGNGQTSRIDLSARPCGPDGAVRVCTPERTDWYRLDIPAEVASRTLCGPGAGDSCEPTRYRSAGLALVRVDLVDGPSAGGRGEYDFSPPAPFTGDDTVPEPPQYPQLDDFTSALEVIPGSHSSLWVRANLDRAATVRASVYPTAGGPPPCLLDGATGSATSATLTPNHFFPLDGLCAGHAYFVALEMTDADGDVSYAAVSGLDVPAPRQRWFGAAFVPGFDANVDVEMQILNLPRAGRDGLGFLTGAQVTVGGNTFPWPGGSVRGCAEIEDRRGSSVAVSADDVPMTFSNQVEIVVDVGASAGFDRNDDGGPPCEPTGPTRRTLLRATVPAEELLRGPVTLTSPAADLDNSVMVQVVVTARPA